MPHIREVYERLTRMQVNDRQPYAGNLVFSAFSGSHQDAIAKGMAWREEKKLNTWTVPYLPIDPVDVGRTYDSDVIRINSQSGKGGISYILKQNFSISVPEKMRESWLRCETGIRRGTQRVISTVGLRDFRGQLHSLYSILPDFRVSFPSG